MNIRRFLSVVVVVSMTAALGCQPGTEPLKNHTQFKYLLQVSDADVGNEHPAARGNDHQAVSRQPLQSLADRRATQLKVFHQGLFIDG